MPVQAFVLQGICLSRHLSANRIVELQKNKDSFAVRRPSQLRAEWSSCATSAGPKSDWENQRRHVVYPVYFMEIRYDQQRDKLFPPTSTLNILSLLVADITVLTLAALRSFVQTVFCLLVLVGHIRGVREPLWFWEVPSSFQRWLCPITYTTIWEIGVFSLKIY